MANVIFKVGTLAQYNALEVKNANTLYWLTDVPCVYKGDLLFGIGSVATETMAGLLSPEDKAKLDAITASGNVIDFSALDASILITDTDGGKAISVGLSAVEGNAIVLKEDGLFVPTVAAPIIPEYSMERQETAADGFAATYRLKKTSGKDVAYVGDSINIPKDMVLQSGSLQEVVIDGVPYDGAKVGDPYIDLVLSDADSTHIYIPASGLVDVYVAGNGIDITDNTVTVKLDATQANGLALTAEGLGLALATATTAGAMSPADKVALDAIATTYATKEEVEILSTNVSVLEEAYTWGEI